ncbi:MAG: DUF4382 domain-containing protein [Candidatus Levybacteria bacterium]|nr:DUF4382 domain-containing protein [Candidatus Levybacteria bacterium]
MAKNSKKSNRNIAIVIFLAIAIVVTVSLVSQKTTWFNFSIGPYGTPAITNLNSANEIVTTNNPDGTMGPDTFSENASNALPSYLKGTLFFKVTDPPQGGKPTSLPTQARASDKGSSFSQKNGPQEILGLDLTISKVEVHIAYQGDPKDSNSRPSNQGKIDRWETLNLETPVTVDLVEIANTQNPVLLAISSLAAGRYTEVRLYLSGASAILANEDSVDLEIPGRDNIVRIVKSFVINPQGETTVTVDFDAQKSVIKAGNKYLLKPVVSKIIVE